MYTISTEHIQHKCQACERALNARATTTTTTLLNGGDATTYRICAHARAGDVTHAAAQPSTEDEIIKWRERCDTDTRMTHAHSASTTRLIESGCAVAQPNCAVFRVVARCVRGCDGTALAGHVLGSGGGGVFLAYF